MDSKSFTAWDSASSPSILNPSEHESLLQLISTAGATLDIDRNRARDALNRAVALLRIPAAVRETKESAKPAAYRGGLAAWQAKRTVAYISEHLSSKFCASDLAQLVTLSTSHFFRAFRESFGEAPMLYVARQRMRHAQQLMLRSREPLSQIALACGLCDQAHFTRVFRRIIGQSPHAWRRQFAHDPELTARR